MALKPFNSIGGFSVGEVASNVILANGDITTTNITTTGISNLNSIGNIRISGGTAGQVIITDGTGNLTFSTVDTSIISNGTSNVSVASSGNVTTAVAGNAIFTVTEAGANLVGNLSVGGILTDNIFHANGAPFDLQQAQGPNTAIQFNLDNDFGGSANLTFDPNTNLLSVGGNIAGQNVNAGNLLTANFVGGTLTTAAQPNITSVGSLTGLTVGNSTSNVVIADTGTIVATGNITAPTFFGNVIGNISGNIVVPGSNTEVIFNNEGNAGASNAFTFNTSSNVLTVSGNVDATNFIGNGAALTGINASNISSGTLDTARLSGTYTIDINGDATTAGTVTAAAQPNITSVGTLTSLDVTGNVASGNLSATGAVSGATLTGNLTTAAQPNITSLGTLANLTVTGDITTSANLVTNLIVGRTTGINITATGTDQNIVLTPTGTGIVDVSNKILGNLATPVAATDAATKAYVDTVAEGLHIHASVAAGTTTTLASSTGGTITYDNGTAGVGATLTVSGGTYTTLDGVTLTNGMRILVKNEANLAHNGIYVRTSTTVLTRATDFDTAAEIQGGDFVFITGGDTLDSTGFVQIDDVNVVGTDPIVWEQFSGAGTFTAGTGLTLTGDVFSISNTTVTSGSYGSGDSVATFTVNDQGQLTAAANVSIAANAANLTGTTLSSNILDSSLTSVGTLGSLNVTGNVAAGNVSATNVSGTLTTAAQPNITSVGTLSSLTVTGNVAAGNVSGTTGAFTNVSGNGSALTDITGANVSGQVGNALVAGTVYTNAQPNITSVGTLTSLAVTGNVTTGNVSGTTGAFTTANVSGNVIVGGTTVSAGSVTTTATTANATIASFPVSGTTGIEFLVKGIDSTGSKYSVAKVVAVTDGTTVDYTVFATVNIGTSTGSGLQVVLDGTDVKLQVTPSSSNSTVWTTQYNLV